MVAGLGLGELGCVLTKPSVTSTDSCQEPLERSAQGRKGFRLVPSIQSA